MKPYQEQRNTRLYVIDNGYVVELMGQLPTWFKPYKYFTR